LKNTNSQKFRILWKGGITGPFSTDEVEAKLKSNDVGIWAEISDGEGAWQPISEWRDRPKATPVAATHPQTPPPPSDNQQAPTAEHASSSLRFGQQPEVEPDMGDLPPLPPLRAAQVDRSDSSDDTKWDDSQYEQAAKPPADGGFFYWAFMPFKKFGVFSGRARRKEYWLFTLINVIVGFSLGVIEAALDIASGTEESLLVSVYTLIVLIPSLAVTVRRLHDTNRSGWWCWLWMIPVIGGLILLFFSVQDGTDGENDYGQNSK
jgi:uncharacterized membrane protein YhaH (DUF805 family)